jgi:hypothetical protein
MLIRLDTVKQPLQCIFFQPVLSDYLPLIPVKAGTTGV